MRGLVIRAGKPSSTVSYDDGLPAVHASAPECRVRVTTAGICATDLALARGYMSFEGVPGHEFVGVAVDGPLAGKRVVGEINAACGRCDRCALGMGRHCASRTVLGILGRSGAFAEELALPLENLHVVPDDVPDDQAVFTEPLAAAFEIAEQLELAEFPRALVLGDGRLGLLCAHVLALHGVEVTVHGRHPERAELLPAGATHGGAIPEPDAAGGGAAARSPLVVEATGDPAVLTRALALTAPRGTVVLKTTSERATPLDLAPLVVDEITLLGSRCGAFAPALAALSDGRVDLAPWIHARFPLADGPQAFARAARPGTLKVLLDIAPS